MKKTLAFIASLVMMATAFVSCGKKDDDESNTGKKSGSSSSVDKSDDDDEDDDDEDDEDEDEDDKKSSKKDKDDDDEEETKPSKKDKDDEDEDDDDEDDEDYSKPSNKSDGSIIGTWVLDEASMEEFNYFMDLNSVEFVFSDSVIEANMIVDMSDMMYIQGDSIVIEDESADYDYDGKVLTIYEEDEAIELKRVGSADKSSMYGRYSSDEESFMGDDSQVYFDFVDDGLTYMVISMKQEYIYDEQTGILTTIDEDGYDEDNQIEINGDKMTITSEVDGAMTFTRKK